MSERKPIEPKWTCMSKSKCCQECCWVKCPYCGYMFLYRVIVLMEGHDCDASYFPDPFKIVNPAREIVEIAGHKRVMHHLRVKCHNCWTVQFVRRVMGITCEKCGEPFRWVSPRECNYWPREA